jgi:methyl-accepting chemotaxis protein
MSLFARRKRYFVERGFQLRFARFVLLFMLACCLITGLSVFYATFVVLSDKLAGIYPQGRLAQVLRPAYSGLFFGLVVVMPVIFYGAVVFSHRLAGPLPKIYQALRDIGAGNFDVKLTLRKKDELKELADEINAMAVRLKERETPK